jgi:hypothetical protein
MLRLCFLTTFLARPIKDRAIFPCICLRLITGTLFIAPAFHFIVTKLTDPSFSSSHFNFNPVDPNILSSDPQRKYIMVMPHRYACELPPFAPLASISPKVHALMGSKCHVQPCKVNGTASPYGSAQHVGPDTKE